MAACRYCGSEVPENDRFCYSCGADLYAEQPCVEQAMQGFISYEEADLRLRAEGKVAARVSLMEHIGAYIIVNAFIFLIWALTTWGGYPWFLFVMIPWGMGLAFHVMKFLTGTKNEYKRELMIKKEIERIRKNQEKVDLKNEAIAEAEAAEQGKQEDESQ